MSVALLDSLDAEQRAAALLPDGPALIIAPAGSGKTTTLIARLGVLLSRGVDPAAILVVTFNRDAARELASRIAARLAPLAPGAGAIEVRTLHALGRQILLDAGVAARIVPDRFPLLRAARREMLSRAGSDRAPASGEAPASVDALDAELSRWKLESVDPTAAAAPIIAAYQRMLAARSAIDFDDLIATSVRLLEQRSELRDRWQRRFSHVLVDEFQDVDAAQLRLIGLLAAPQDNLFVVGDDDQTIYAWRLADVRRILDFPVRYPAAGRVTLATNYRCPRPVVEASRRLIEHNAERFAKEIHAASRRDAPDDRVRCVSTGEPDWPARLTRLLAREAAQGRVCALARTRSELTPVALALLSAGIPHATEHALPLEAAPVASLIGDLTRGLSGTPYEVLRGAREARGWSRRNGDDLSDEDHAALDAATGWAASFGDVGSFLDGYHAAVGRVRALRRADAPIQLATVHGAKGLEWPAVVIIGFEADRFPNRRALADAADPRRALEEERRLAYVALTRTKRRLILAYDPARPSPFLAELGGASPRVRPRVRSW